MRIPMRLLRVTAVGPLVLASTLLTVMVLALLPPLAALAGFVTCMVLLSVLAGGRLEETTLQVVSGARKPTHGERAAMRPVLARLATAGVSVPDFYVDRGARAPRPAIMRGRRSLIVSRRLVEATYRGELSRNEAAALLGHAIGRHRAHPHRFELLLWAWTTPCRCLLAMAGGIGAAAGWFPLVRPAWRLRFIVATICVVQSVTEGRTVYGLIAGAFIALTYAMPWANRTIEARVEVTADAFVGDHDLGADLENLLHRSGRTVPLDRLHRLKNHQSRRRLTSC